MTKVTTTKVGATERTYSCSSFFCLSWIVILTAKLPVRKKTITHSLWKRRPRKQRTRLQKFFVFSKEEEARKKRFFHFFLLFFFRFNRHSNAFAPPPLQVSFSGQSISQSQEKPLSEP